MKEVKETTKRKLASRSGDRCAYPRCDRYLTVNGKGGGDLAFLGIAAHIAGEKQGAARYDSSMTDEQRRSYDNLIYLCGYHHDLIDKQEQDHSIEQLKKLKAKHEDRVREGVNEAIADVGFPELEKAVKGIIQMPPCESSRDFTPPVPPEEKIKKNQLSDNKHIDIKVGLAIAHEVKRFIQIEAQNAPDFAERLKAGFLEKYYKLWREGNRGDDLFDLMCGYAEQGFRDQTMRAAGRGILIYLFELCEVFEK